MKKLSFFVVGLMFCSSTLFAESASWLLQKKLTHLQNMRAKFTQKVYAKEHVLSSSSGTMALQRPGRFLWETQEPAVQKVIADGQRLWVYDVDLEQVTVSTQKKSLGSTAAMFLSEDKSSLDRDYTIQVKDSGQDTVFDMQTKSLQSNIQRVVLRFRGDVLRGMDLFDQMGQRTHIVFIQPEMNHVIPSHVFQFKPPKGVDVVKQDQGA
ncbi:MAG: outer membrane lipoprotein chaperone LolA [Legionellaceae bacterium]